MKLALITIIIFCLSQRLIAQNGIDPVRLINKDTISVINTSDSLFVKAFNWSSQGARLDSAMHINFYHSVNLDTSLHDYYPSARLMQPLEHPTREIIGGRNSTRLFQAHSLYLDPTIMVDSTMNFKPKPYDNTGAVFGFLYKSKVRLIDSNHHLDPNYSRAILHKDSLTTGQSHIVLKNIWKNNILLPSSFKS